MARKLVIVESPTKSKTIGGYLGADYDVVASVGHIRDLAERSELPAEVKKGDIGKFAIDIAGGFVPYYVVSPDKKKIITDLKRRLKEADELYLATDEDREGEAIAWHLLEVLKPKVPVKRLAFHEITREGIERAMAAPREVNTELVEAQEARRLLDRLYGYEVSPVLWRKIQQGLSAGRVQSVTLRLVVDRERERMAFQSAEYWDLAARFTATEGPDRGRSFAAKLTSVDGKRVATGKDFDDRGALTNSKVVHVTGALAGALAAGLAEASFSVTSVDSKPYKRRPAAPFITSTLIQESSRKLRLSARQAMSVAQGLYQKGFITYMRSDSPTLSAEAVRAARSQAAELYGSDSVAASARVYASKDSNAQEAHEAIRPAGDRFRTPDSVRSELRGDEFRMYEMIWKRTVASQMADAEGTTSTVRIGATTAAHHAVEFSASGTIITKPGFLAAYEESREKERYEEDEQKVGREGDARLPQLAASQKVDAEDIEPLTHATTPPPRFTQGSMIKELEDRKLGRPSTYAAMVDVIIDRGYVRVDRQQLVPNWIAFAIIRLLEEHFSWLIDYDFTADMEQDLDRIADGELSRLDWLSEFYFGSGEEEDGRGQGLKALAENLGDIDARANSTFEVGDGIVLRVGRYGPYIEREVDGEQQRASVPEDLSPDELTVAKAEELLANQGGDERELGTHPESGLPVVAKAGRFGPYVTEVLPDDAKGKPRTASLFKSMDLTTVTLEDALRLMSLPRVVGVADDGEEITAQNGRFGPYLKKGTDSRTIESEEQLLSITLEEALAIYAQPKRGRGRTAAPPLKELGTDPVSEKPVVVKSGRFGDYITDGTTNVTIPKDLTLDSLTEEKAYELLAEKRAKGPAKKPARRTAARKTTTRKKS
ncbi:type I DNA topoisomerase [Demequina sp. SYSU T00039]|uniref:DNA topoisomerase 1 n=1 Tax=Demequina lignilytica TaxID=3051663 RepID=A0AAW7M775_9MICO|nr:MULTISPECIES: type I DNA topoisomerase [unclassified Demequina]MDN4478588.1 type I DNA topoisomerase [Demequina sp. SYSU T00039-1]MDN4488566.1 type I DNA topoisomerase [Demequina sp. SYSU T00039]MDN4491573.1 type I DNA topoisomerase [Demequina sp. SYSU T00068]